MQSQEAEVLRDEPMSRHTSWRVGGTADVYFRPASRASLIAFLKSLDGQTPITWVGLGSNLLVRDRGIRGVVISTAGVLDELTHPGGGVVVVGAGVPCTVFAKQCARWGVGPAEFFAGIPGTIGGALAMNAGAFGGETWNCVRSLETVDRHGVVRTRDVAEYRIGYREVIGPIGEWFLGARMQLDLKQPTELERVRALVRDRQTKQPLGRPSCGSVFRNPPGDFAGRLIEAAGLKGFRIGGAEISEKHANFIINTGGAKAADIEGLIAHVRATVMDRFGIELVHEVHIVGEPGDPGAQADSPC
jgi:UDP-N-acetylmuramate dehydrogenase